MKKEHKEGLELGIKLGLNAGIQHMRQKLVNGRLGGGLSSDTDLFAVHVLNTMPSPEQVFAEAEREYGPPTKA